MRSSAPSPRSSPRPSSASPRLELGIPTAGEFGGDADNSGFITKSSFPRHLYVTRLQPDWGYSELGKGWVFRSMAEEFTGWQRDPSGVHEYRYFSYDGRPTRLVSDGGKRGYDPPQNGVRMAPPAAPISPRRSLPSSLFCTWLTAEPQRWERGASVMAAPRAPHPSPHGAGAPILARPRLRPMRARASKAVGANRSLVSWRALSLRLAAGSQRPPRLATVHRRGHCSRVSTWVRQIPLDRILLLSDPDQPDHRLGLSAVEQFLGRHGRIGR